MTARAASKSGYTPVVAPRRPAHCNPLCRPMPKITPAAPVTAPPFASLAPIFFRRSPTTESPTTAYTAPTSFPDRKSTLLNSSHGYISYAVFCLKKNNHCAAIPVSYAPELLRQVSEALMIITIAPQRRRPDDPLVLTAVPSSVVASFREALHTVD